MYNRFAIDEWVIIPIGDKKTLLGREVGTTSYRVTSEVIKIDTTNPPRWAATKSGSHYDLLNRATSIGKYAYTAVMDTLLKRGYAAEDVAYFLVEADRIIKTCNTEEVISMFLK